MRKGIKYSLIGLLVLFVILLTGGSFYMLGYSLTPEDNEGKDIPGSYEYMLSEYPHIKPWLDSLQTIGALRDTFIINSEGRQLHAIFAAAPEPTNKTAVIVHGYTDNAVRMLMIGHLYNKELKYNILLPDLQDQGLSDGPAIQMGWKDRLDVLQWMDVAHNLFKKPYEWKSDTVYNSKGEWQIFSESGHTIQMVVHGISMGAATTMMVSGEEKAFAKCYIEDCGYTSVWDEFSYELKNKFNLPAFPLMYSASLLCDAKYGWNFKEASSLNQVKKCRRPMLFIHSDADTYVPTRMVYPLFEAKPEPKELWIVPGAKHAMSYRDYPQEYTERVKNFVEKYIH